MSNFSEDIEVATELYYDIENAKIDLNLSSFIHDFRCGWKSNIPICCIIFLSLPSEILGTHSINFLLMNCKY